MDIYESMTTSWGKRDVEVDVRALRQYQIIQSRIETIGEILVFLLLTGILGSTIWLFSNTNFEDVIFYDGSAMTCVLNGQNGEISHVQ